MFNVQCSMYMRRLSLAVTSMAAAMRQRIILWLHTTAAQVPGLKSSSTVVSAPASILSMVAAMLLLCQRQMWISEEHLRYTTSSAVVTVRIRRATVQTIPVLMSVHSTRVQALMVRVMWIHCLRAVWFTRLTVVVTRRVLSRVLLTWPLILNILLTLIAVSWQ